MALDIGLVKSKLPLLSNVFVTRVVQLASGTARFVDVRSQQI